MAKANGITSLMVIKKQSAEGTKATASSAQVMRRVKAEFETAADAINSNEIRASQQKSDSRLSNFRVEGALNGEISPTTFEEFIAAMLRKDFVAGATIGALTTIASITAGFTDSANGFLAAGFKVGMIIRASNFVATENNDKNFLITAVVAGQISCSSLDETAITAQTAGASITIAATGKRTYVPLTSHTEDWFTVAIENSDVSVYRSFVDCIVDKMEIKFPPENMATIDFNFIGKTEDPVSGSVYFTSPTSQTSTGNFSNATSILNFDGILTTICTDLEFALESGAIAKPVVGSKYVSGISRGKVMGNGSFSVFLEDDTYLEKFRDETEMVIAYAVGSTSLKGADAMSFTFPRIKIITAKESDGEEHKIITCDFEILEYVGSDSQYENTTIVIQDTTL